MSLNNKQKQQFKAQAHHLKPIILIGSQGFTAAVQHEIDRALNDHELIKIRIQGEDRLERHEILEKICTALNADLVQTVGRIGTVYRKKQD